MNKTFKMMCATVVAAIAVADAPDSARPNAPNWEQFAADATSPVSRVDRDERHHLLRAALATLAPNDRQILVLRHFDALGNGDCAEILGIEPKAASIRYARALERLHRKLLDLSCFQTKNRNSQ